MNAPGDVRLECDDSGEEWSHDIYNGGRSCVHYNWEASVRVWYEPRQYVDVDASNVPRSAPAASKWRTYNYQCATMWVSKPTIGEVPEVVPVRLVTGRTQRI